MTPAKQEILMQGQTSIARKIYECVPIQEAWQTFQIAHALKAATGTSADLRRVQACLSDLADAGLIREPQKRHFQRVEVKEKPKTQELKMPAEPSLNAIAAATAATAEPKASALDRIAGLAGELSDIADHLRQRLLRVTKIAKELEDVALAVEQERESSSESMAKLSQLKDLLKGL